MAKNIYNIIMEEHVAAVAAVAAGTQDEYYFEHPRQTIANFNFDIVNEAVPDYEMTYTADAEPNKTDAKLLKGDCFAVTPVNTVIKEAIMNIYDMINKYMAAPNEHSKQKEVLQDIRCALIDIKTKLTNQEPDEWLELAEQITHTLRQVGVVNPDVMEVISGLDVVISVVSVPTKMNITPAKGLWEARPAKCINRKNAAGGNQPRRKV